MDGMKYLLQKPAVVAALLSSGMVLGCKGSSNPGQSLDCPKGQFGFDGRCVMQCLENDNTLCELDGSRIQFGAMGGAGSGPSQGCIGVCEKRTIVTLALGGIHTCALLDDESVRCFGDDSFGQLGGSRITGPIADLKAKTLSAGKAHTCAVVEGGKVRCWGQNTYGQLGDGTREDRAVPVEVPGVSGVVQVAAAPNMTFALYATGQVVVWGDTLGSARENEISLVPVETGLEQAKKISATANGVCALREDKSIRCYGWHDGLNGGSSPTESLLLDDQVVLNAIDLACIEKHTCVAILADKRVIAWGFDRWGVTGQGIAQDYFRLATVIPEFTDVVELAGGLNHACARLSSGEMACWGKNGDGQLGYVSPNPAGHYSPFVVPEINDIVGLALGTDSLSTCAKKKDGKFYCWGNNGSGQLGGATKADPLEIP